MSNPLNIQASVIDISRDKPLSTDLFMVDTNVWFWIAYPTSYHGAMPYQIQEYPNYLNQAFQIGAKLYRNSLTFAELAHNIEAAERNIFNISSFHPTNNRDIRPKEFRHDFPNERAKVIAEIEAAWKTIQFLSTPFDITLDDAMVNSALLRLQTEELDGYDLFILEAMKQAHISQIITDDGDFATVPGIQVYTANLSVISQAQQQGKLLVR